MVDGIQLYLGWNQETHRGLRELYAVPTYTRMVGRANATADIGNQLVDSAERLQRKFDKRSSELVGSLAKVNLALEQNPNDPKRKLEKTLLEGKIAEARRQFDKRIDNIVAKQSGRLNALNFSLSQGREGITRSDTAAGSSAGEYAQRLDSIVFGARSMNLHPSVRKQIADAVSSQFQRHAVSEEGGVAAEEH